MNTNEYGDRERLADLEKQLRKLGRLIGCTTGGTFETHPPGAIVDAAIRCISRTLPSIGDGKDGERVKHYEGSSGISCKERPYTIEELTEHSRLYFDLIFAVGQKYDGESRHETAKRYIIERETHNGPTAMSAQSPQAGREEKK